MRKTRTVIKDRRFYLNSIVSCKTTLLKKKISVPYYQPLTSNRRSNFFNGLKKNYKTLGYQNIVNVLIEKNIPCFNSFDKKFKLTHLNIEKFEEFCDHYQMDVVKKVKTYILLFFHFKTATDQEKSDYLKAWQYLNHDDRTVKLAFNLMRQYLTSENIPLDTQIAVMNTVFSEVKFECKKSSTGDFIDVLGQKVKITFNFKPKWLAEIKDITADFNQCMVTPTIKEVNAEVFLELEVQFPQNMVGQSIKISGNINT